jgi:hypothetical protein
MFNLQLRAPLMHVFGLALAIVCSQTVAPVARAGTIINMEFSVDGGASWTKLSPGDSTFGNLQFNDLGATALENPAKLFGSASTVMNTGGADINVRLAFVASGYLAPNSTPLNISSILSGNYGGNPTVHFQTFVDPQTDNTRRLNSRAARAITGPQSATFDPINGSYSTGKSSGTIASLSSPFSILQVATVTLHSGDWIQINSNAQIAATPEPRSSTLLGIGLFGLTAVYCWRFRRPLKRGGSESMA